MDNLINDISVDLEAAKKEFNEKINSIRNKYGFTDFGISVSKPAVISFSYEELLDISKNYKK